MSREAFEAWRQRDFLDAPVHTSGSDKQWRAWQAARATALEEAAERVKPAWGQACADAIRALKEKE